METSEIESRGVSGRQDSRCLAEEAKPQMTYRVEDAERVKEDGDIGNRKKPRLKTRARWYTILLKMDNQRRIVLFGLIGVVILAFVLLLPSWFSRTTQPPQPAQTAAPESIRPAADSTAYTQEREAMVLGQIEARGVDDPDVLRAMRTVPRHQFVLEKYLDQAYDDHPLPIDYGQTISQPYIVAWMTELLELEPDYRVLEIGTGSGYQAAVLAEFVAEVYTIEIVPELAESARQRLEALGYDTIHVLRADGYYGWEEYAPFDAIIVTAAPDHLPQPLIQQLKENAHLVIPIGPPGGYQSLWQFTMVEGEPVARELGGVSFVPLTRE